MKAFNSGCTGTVGPRNPVMNVGHPYFLGKLAVWTIQMKIWAKFLYRQTQPKPISSFY